MRPPPRTLGKSQLQVMTQMPLVTWRMADGSAEIQARQIAIHQDNFVEVLTENGQVRTLLLSRLNPADASRAFAERDARRVKARRLITQALDEALKKLEKQDLRRFLVDHVLPPTAGAPPTGAEPSDWIKQRTESLRRSPNHRQRLAQRIKTAKTWIDKPYALSRFSQIDELVLFNPVSGPILTLRNDVAGWKFVLD